MRRVALLVLAGAVLLAFSWQLILINFHHASLSEPEIISLAFTSEFILLIVVGMLLRHTVNGRKNLHYLNLEMAKAIVQRDNQQKIFDTVFDNTNVGIAMLDLTGHMTKVNQELCQLLGYDQSELHTLNIYALFHANDITDLQQCLQDLIDGKMIVYQNEHQCYKKSKKSFWVMMILSLVKDHHDKPARFIAQIQDISLQKKAEERLQHMAYHDPLTGLANRNKLEQFLNHLIAVSRRQQTGFGVMFLDLDRFKNINDTIGHEAGDMLLQIIAERIRSTVRNTDMVARLGGDEFVLLITDVKRTESLAIIAQKILENVLRAITVQGQELYITTSIGISLYPFDGQNMQSLMKHADLALYRAKEHGRNNYQFYTDEMTTKAQDKLAMQNALGHALAKDEFLLNYQPKMEIKTRKITGTEALLRWKNKEYGTVTPDEIILLAEETGLIIPVSEWIIKTACRQLKYWHDMGLTSLTIAVNCSKRQFKYGNFVDNVLKTISQEVISPRSLEIEITESIIMEDPENSLRVLYALKDLGVQIVVDDFGTGYWSLNNLRRLSIDKIKIDKTFIKQVTFDETSAAITTAILAMAHKLNIKTIAEGVETREQYEFLMKEGCDEIQGYYLTQPLPDELMTKFLKHPVPDAEVISRAEENV